MLQISAFVTVLYYRCLDNHSIAEWNVTTRNTTILPQAINIATYTCNIYTRE